MTTTPTLWGTEKIIATPINPGAAMITGLSNNSFVFVWDEAGTGRDIAAGRYNELGVFQAGSDFLAAVSNATGSDLNGPSIVQLANGNLMTGYTKETAVGDNDIRSVVSAAPAFTSASDHGVNTSGADTYVVNDVAARINGGAAFLYQQSVTTVASDDTYLALVNADGTPSGAAINIDTSASQAQQNGEVVSLTNGNLVVAYENFNYNGGSSIRDIRYRVFDANGNDIATENVVSGSSGDAGSGGAFPSLAALSNGNWVVTYQESGHISYKIYNSSGNAVSSELTFSDPGILPEVTALKDGGFMIGWSRFVDPESDGTKEGDVVLQRFDEDGGIVGHQIVLGNDGDQWISDLATLADGRVVVSYNSETGGGTNITQAAFQILDPRDAFIEGDNEDNNIVGRLGDSHISGLEGNDKIIAMGGDDTVDGGAGNDTAAGGNGDDLLTGASGSDTLNGQAQDDTIGGGAAGDTLNGDAGDDLIHGNSANDVLHGNDDDDALFGDSGDDVIYGDAGSDELHGGNGADIMTGGAGSDSHWGGLGNDTFDFNAVSESPNSALGRDTIFDFVQGQDHINLHDIDAKTGPAGNQDFAFIGGAAFSAEGQISFSVVGGDTYIQVNTTGPGGAEMSIKLEGAYALAAGDFVL